MFYIDPEKKEKAEEKLKKLGVDFKFLPIEMEQVGTPKNPRVKIYLPVEILSKQKVEKGEILGTIEHMGMVRGKPCNHVYMFDKDKEMKKYNEMSPKEIGCIHCKSNRKRKYWYLIKKDGKISTLGKSCAKEYFGINIGSMLDALHRYGKTQPMEIHEVSVDDIVKAFCKVFPTKKYLKKGQAINLTLNYIKPLENYFGNFTQDKKYNKKLYKYLNSCLEKQKHEYLNKDFSQLKYWEKEILIMLEVGLDKHKVVKKTERIITTLFFNYLTWIKKNRKSQPPKEYLGTVGEKIEFEFTTKLVKEFENNYNSVTLFCVGNSGKAPVKFYYSGNKFYRKIKELNTGDVIKLKAKVSKQETSKYGKVTVVKRVSII